MGLGDNNWLKRPTKWLYCPHFWSGNPKSLGNTTECLKSPPLLYQQNNSTYRNVLCWFCIKTTILHITKPDSQNFFFATQSGQECWTKVLETLSMLSRTWIVLEGQFHQIVFWIRNMYNVIDAFII